MHALKTIPSFRSWRPTFSSQRYYLGNQEDVSKVNTKSGVLARAAHSNPEIKSRVSRRPFAKHTQVPPEFMEASGILGRRLATLRQRTVLSGQAGVRLAVVRPASTM